MDLSEIVIESFSDRPMNAVDWVLFAVSAVMLIGLVLRILPFGKKSKTWKEVAEQIFYISISVLGLINIVVAFVDYATIEPGKYLLRMFAGYGIAAFPANNQRLHGTEPACSNGRVDSVPHNQGCILSSSHPRSAGE